MIAASGGVRPAVLSADLGQPGPAASVAERADRRLEGRPGLGPVDAAAQVIAAVGDSELRGLREQWENAPTGGVQ
jgi:hypothetical protein